MLRTREEEGKEDAHLAASCELGEYRERMCQFVCINVCEAKRNPCGRRGFEAQTEDVKPAVEVTSRLKVLLPKHFLLWSHNIHPLFLTI